LLHRVRILHHEQLHQLEKLINSLKTENLETATQIISVVNYIWVVHVVGSDVFEGPLDVLVAGKVSSETPRLLAAQS